MLSAATCFDLRSSSLLQNKSENAVYILGSHMFTMLKHLLCTFSYQLEDKIYAEYMWTKGKAIHQFNVNTQQ